MRSVQPDPAALPAHAHGIGLAEAGDVPRQPETAVPFDAPFLRCLDPLGKDQRVVGEIGKLANDLGLIDRRC
jgi:hypothetical protein